MQDPPDGLVLIDAGWGAEESWRALRDALESIGAGVADVRGVLVTHMHFDHPLAAGRGVDLVPALGPVQRPDADLRGHRDRRARAPAGAPRPGDHEPDPPARVHGEGGMTGPAAGDPSQLLAARPAGSSTGAVGRSALLRSGSKAAADTVITTHAMM